MQLLIGRGAVVDNEVLKMASRHQTAAVTSFLLSQGATDEDTFALSFAAGEGKVDIVRALLESQEYSEEALQRTLHEAARVGALDVISYLLDYGMDIDTRDNRGNTTLLATCRSVFPCRPRPDVIQYLISRGANVLSCTVAAPEDPQGGGNNARSWLLTCTTTDGL
jgi:ankyrin repeat protein